MPPGRPKKTAHLAHVAGDPGKRGGDRAARKKAAAAEVEAAPKLALPQPTRKLTTPERTVFRRIARLLHERGQATHLDRDIIVMAARWIAAEDAAWADYHDSRLGATVVLANGVTTINPALAVAEKCATRALAAMARLGMSPSDRKGLSALPAPREHEDGDDLGIG